MASSDYEKLNKANWDERAPEHVKSDGYAVKRFQSDPSFTSGVVRFDTPLLGSVDGLHVVHLQCHIGTDTLSLARRGAASVAGLDFSPASLAAARSLAASAAGGEKLRFVEASLYDAPGVLQKESFDLVFTGIGALCWLPSITRWAETVAALLKPGGRLFIREGHPILWTLDDKVADRLVIRYPYFEQVEPSVSDDNGTYVRLAEEKRFRSTTTVEWNHGIGEIVTALFGVGMRITGLVEHDSVPWEAFPGQMVEDEMGEWRLKVGRERLPLSYTLQAIKGI